MSDKKIEVFKALRMVMQNNPHETKAHDCLKLMCEDSIDSLEKGNMDVVSFSKWKLKARLHNEHQVNELDIKSVQRWIKYEDLTGALDQILSLNNIFEHIGFNPVLKQNQTSGGRGNERLYWLDIEEVIVDDESLEISEIENIHQITYSRVESNEIKISWLYKIIFKNGELKNRSFGGIVFICYMFLSLVFFALCLLTLIIIFMWIDRDFKLLNILSVVSLIIISISTWLTWKYHFVPIWNLPDHRVIKAPSMFLALSELDADIEMYRDKDRNKITRFTRFTATCPICTADIILREGMPYQQAPLVGRCTESPFAHVYSFDRMTMKGYLLTKFNESWN